MSKGSPVALAAIGFYQLGIEFRHIARVAALSFHHRDPFDRLIAAQAVEEGLPVAFADPVFLKFVLVNTDLLGAYSRGQALIFAARIGQSVT